MSLDIDIYLQKNYRKNNKNRLEYTIEHLINIRNDWDLLGLLEIQNCTSREFEGASILELYKNSGNENLKEFIENFNIKDNSEQIYEFKIWY